MRSQPQQQSGVIATAIAAAHTPPPLQFTVAQFSARNPAFSEPALRNLIFKAGARQSSRGEVPGNGLVEAGAILRIGRKVLIDEGRFFDWVQQQNGAR